MVATLTEVRPHGFFGVPRVWEKFAARMDQAVSGLEGDRRTAVDQAREIALEAYRIRADGSALPDLGSLSTFGSWESVASTIVHKAVTLSGFNPGSADFDPVAWNNFLHKFATIPFFLTYTFDNRDASISKISLQKGVDAISDLVENIMTPANFQGIVTTIKKIATLALENQGQTQKNSNQQVGVLSRHDKTLYLGAVRTQVEMEYKSGKGGYEPLQQTLTIYRGYGVLDFDKCIRNAKTLIKWDSLVNAWVRNTSSYAVSPNGSPAWTAEPSLHTSSYLAV